MRQEIAPLKTRTSREVPQAVVAIEGGPGEHPGCQDAAVYIRGNPANKGPIVPRAFPRALAGDNQPPITKGSGRLELAAWLTNPHHPLTARVMVNRIWHHHFGEGLVRTTCNLGTLGDRPAHPELLDFLAGQFVKAGWSIKAMHRLILLSSVYQQSCHTSPAVLAADPENRLLGRMNRRRLEAEAVRDNLLAVAGRLDRTMGGPATADTASTRRGLYLMSARTGAATSFFTQLFDGANCAGIVEERGNSVVAPQALFMLNDPQVTELAKALAMRVAEESNSVDPAVRLERLYQIAVGRLPSETEIQIGREFLGEQPTEAAWARYSQILLCTNEFIYVD